MTTVKRSDYLTLERARSSFEAQPPEGFLRLAEWERKRKLYLREVVELKWKRDIEDCVVESWAPRQKPEHGRFAKAGDDLPMLGWYLWSLPLLTELANLASTKNCKLEVAQELIQGEVSKRHAGPNNTYKEVAQVLPSDVKLAIAALEERNRQDVAKKDARVARGVHPDKETDDEDEPDYDAIAQTFKRGSGQPHAGAGKSDKEKERRDAGSTVAGNIPSSSPVGYEMGQESVERQRAACQASAIRIYRMRVERDRLRSMAADLEGKEAANMEAEAAALDAKREELVALHEAQFMGEFAGA